MEAIDIEKNNFVVTHEANDAGIVINIALFEGEKVLRRLIHRMEGVKYCCPHCGQQIYKGGDRFCVAVNTYYSNEKRIILKFSDHCSGGVYSQMNILLDL